MREGCGLNGEIIKDPKKENSIVLEIAIRMYLEIILDYLSQL